MSVGSCLPAPLDRLPFDEDLAVREAVSKYCDLVRFIAVRESTEMTKGDIDSTNKKTCNTSPKQALQVIGAERTGFEPVEPVIPTHRISNPALSTTQPSLRIELSVDKIPTRVFCESTSQRINRQRFAPMLPLAGC